jgi:hypothetical protein
LSRWRRSAILNSELKSFDNKLLSQFAVIPMGLALIFVLPIIMNEIFLGIWLIVKGFNPSVIAPEPAKQP